MKGVDANQFDRWIRLNQDYAPDNVIDSAVFVRDTLELAKSIALSLDMPEGIWTFEVYDRLIQRIKEN
jgi:hypothetical protein